VKADLQGEPAAGARVVAARVVPLNALVSGPASRLALLEQVMTLPILLSGHARDFEQVVAIRPPEALISILREPTVNVKVDLEIPNVSPDLFDAEELELSDDPLDDLPPTGPDDDNAPSVRH